MTEPVTPKAERRVIDGEVVDQPQDSPQDSSKDSSPKRSQSSSQSAFSGKQASQKGQAKTSAETQSSPTVRIPVWAKKSLWWLLMVAVVVATLFYTRPNQDWQIEHINRLQSQVAQLHETNQLLVSKVEQQQQEIDKKITEVLNRPENQPLVSQGDLDALKAEVADQVGAVKQELQQQLQTIGDEAESKWETLADKAQQALQPSEQDVQSLTQFKENVQTQLSQVGEDLARLFDFKAKQENQLQQAEPSKTNEPAPLSSLQVQQWMVAINTQWLLEGNAQKTQQQLLALEQAVALSDIAIKTELARRIGEDLSYAKQFSANLLNQRSQQTQVINQLNALVEQLSAPSLKGFELSSEEPETASDSSVDKLLNKFSGLISLKKREDGESLSEVESLLRFDVLKQRLSLLIDRLDWAFTTQSAEQVEQASGQIKAFVGQHFPKQASAFETLLSEASVQSVPQRNTLSIIAASRQEGLDAVQP